MGLNLEVPGAALVADLLAPEVEFFSVGTNDLVQYLLAADRNDPRVAGLYQPLHPAVLRTLVQVVAAAEGQQVPLSVCGEMAAEPSHAVLLVGLGFRALCMSPAAIPRVKAAIRAVAEPTRSRWPRAAWASAAGWRSRRRCGRRCQVSCKSGRDGQPRSPRAGLGERGLE